MTPAALGAAMSGDLKNAIIASTPGGIERQEKEGQIEQSFLETLPKDIRDQRPLFEAVGFVFGESYDDLFDKVTFPKGWRKQATEHSMGTNIVDDKGRERGAIFYKAAFYDRHAHAYLLRRYDVTKDYDGDEAYKVKDRATGAYVFSGTPIARGDWNKDRTEAQRLYEADRAEYAKCIAWLKEKYPDSNNPNAYWD
jgi:hypothetical protein